MANPNPKKSEPAPPLSNIIYKTFCEADQSTAAPINCYWEENCVPFLLIVQIISLMKYRRTNTYLNVIGTLHIQLRHASNGESCKSNLKIQGTSVLECLCRQWKRQLWQWHPEIKNRNVFWIHNCILWLVPSIWRIWMNPDGLLQLQCISKQYKPHEPRTEQKNWKMNF